MKPLVSVRLLALALVAGIFSCSSSQYAQRGSSEYDDLYFNGGDRGAVLVSSDSRTTVIERPVTTENYSDQGVGVGYNSKTLNPDYGLAQDAQVQSSYEEDEYYVEDYDRAYIEDVVDDYLRSSNYSTRRNNRNSYNRGFDDIYWTDPFLYQGTIFDPLYRSYYGVYSPFAYRSYYRPYSSFYSPWRSGISISFGYGYGRYYDPFYSRYYDPFFDPFYYGRGYYGGFGRSYYGGLGYGSAWCPPSYYGRVNNIILVNNIENTSSGNVRYGRRAPRGSNSIISNEGIRQRTTSNSPSSIGRESLRDRSTGTYDRDQRSGTDRIRSREGTYRDSSPTTRPSTPSSNYRSIDRNGSQQRGTINRDVYRQPQRGTQDSRPQVGTPTRNRSYSPSPSSNSPSRISSPNRSSSPSRVSSPNRSSSPSRVSSPSRSSSPSRVSSPSRSSSPSRMSAPSRSTPSRSSGTSGSRSRSQD